MRERDQSKFYHANPKKKKQMVQDFVTGDLGVDQAYYDKNKAFIEILLCLNTNQEKNGEIADIDKATKDALRACFARNPSLDNLRKVFEHPVMKHLYFRRPTRLFGGGQGVISSAANVYSLTG